MAVQYFTKSASLLTDYKDLVFFEGVNDRISFSYMCSGNTIVADGVNQTLTMGRATDNTIIDAGRGLTMDFFAPALNEVVIGFQNDRTGHVAFGASPAGGMTYTPDHHGGILATGGGLSVDFIGMSAAQVEAKVKPYP